MLDASASYTFYLSDQWACEKINTRVLVLVLHILTNCGLVSLHNCTCTRYRTNIIIVSFGIILLQCNYYRKSVCESDEELRVKNEEEIHFFLVCQLRHEHSFDKWAYCFIHYWERRSRVERWEKRVRGVSGRLGLGHPMRVNDNDSFGSTHVSFQKPPSIHATVRRWIQLHKMLGNTYAEQHEKWWTTWKVIIRPRGGGGGWLA
jgi:hypothetical protein